MPYGWQTQKRISSEYLSKTAQGTFYIVTAIVGNGTNAPIVYPTLYLVDERDRKYSSNTDATSTYNTIHNVEVGLCCKAFTANFDDVEFSMPLRVVTERGDFLWRRTFVRNAAP